MFEIDTEKTIHITRGDTVYMELELVDEDGNNYAVSTGDVVRFKVFEKKNHDNVVLQEDVPIFGETKVVDIVLHNEDTAIGEIINKPADYWYEVEVNPETSTHTVIGYDEDGPKVFKLYPEGSVKHE